MDGGHLCDEIQRPLGWCICLYLYVTRNYFFHRSVDCEASRMGSGEGFNPCEKGSSRHVFRMQSPGRHVHNAPLFWTPGSLLRSLPRSR